MSTRRRLALTSFAWLLLSVTSCDSKPAANPAAPPVDPWVSKLQDLRQQYEQNQVKLMSDWRATMGEINSGTLDANKLCADVTRLTREVADDAAKVRDWDRDLSRQLEARGLSKGGTR